MMTTSRPLHFDTIIGPEANNTRAIEVRYVDGVLILRLGPLTVGMTLDTALTHGFGHVDVIHGYLICEWSSVLELVSYVFGQAVTSATRVPSVCSRLTKL